MELHLLSILAVVPLAGALVVAVVGRLAPGRDRLLHAIAAASALVTFAVSLPLWRGFAVRGAQWQFTDQLFMLPSIGAGAVFGVDGLGMLLVLLTTTITCLAIAAPWANVAARPPQYFVAILLLEGGMLSVYAALDLMLLVVGWTVAAFSICVAVSASDGRERSLPRIALVAVVPCLLLLAGVLVLYTQGGTLTGAPTFDVRMFQNLTMPVTAQRWAFIGFFAGFVVGNFGVFRWWLSVGSDVRTTAVPLVLAALFLKMTTFGFLRLCLPLLPDATRQFAPGLLAVGALLTVLAAVAAFAQTSWTRVLAYASVGHLCLVTIGAFALTPQGLTGSAVHQVNHGLSIAALFLIAAVVTDRGHSTSISDYGGLLNAMPIVAGVWLFLTLSLVGVPKLNGLTGAALIFKGVWPISKTWAIVAVAGQALSAMALLWLFARMMLGELRGPAAEVLKDLRLREAAVVLPLVALVVWAGIKPGVLLSAVETSVARVVLRVSPQYGPEVADCLAQPPPPPDPLLPVGITLTAPCSDGAGHASTDPHEEAGRKR